MDLIHLLTPFPSLPPSLSLGSGPSIEGTHQQQQQLQQQQQQSQPQPTAIPPLVPFAATNEKGQRICRQCGIVGRYKDGKCVEKWGPGPCGPGTVCDRYVGFFFLGLGVLFCCFFFVFAFLFLFCFVFCFLSPIHIHPCGERERMLGGSGWT